MSATPQDRNFPKRAQRVRGAGNRQLFLAVGFLQGLSLYFVSEVDWFAQRPVLGYALRMIVWAWPVLFLMTYRAGRVFRGACWVSGFVALLALLAAYIGWQATPAERIDENSLETILVSSTLVAGFVALLHLQATVWRTDRKYDRVFTLSWRNFLTFALSWALMLIVWLLLYLWGLLFSVIGIEYFEELFEQEWFRMPALATVFAFGLSIFSPATSLLDRIASLLERLMWLLLPLTVLITTLFLLSIVFTGLQSFLETERGIGLLMTLNLMALFFLNATYQTGAKNPYPKMVHRLVSGGLLLLPVVSLLALWGVAARVIEHGWMLGRCWAAFVLGLAAVFSSAYAYAIVRRREAWPSHLANVNKPMSWVLLVALLLTCTPLLDFRVITTQNQFARIESGRLALDEISFRPTSDGRFNWWAAQTYLARPAYLRMQALAASIEDSDPGRASRLRVLIGDEEQPAGWTERQLQNMVLRPEPFEIPEGLDEAVMGRGSEIPDVLFRVDLGGDRQAEYVTVFFDSDGQRVSALCWQQNGTTWQLCGDVWLRSDSPEALFEQITGADFEAIKPDSPYKNLRIGDLVLDFN
ncbi:MAG: DUF4153 domain-containing protein [Gammaproteobacteria bacterium]|nr:DUF4153 domain-containing protein [Gammaproteobacteria bacterium]